MSGIRTPNLPATPVITELLGHGSVGGQLSTVRIALADLAGLLSVATSVLRLTFATKAAMDAAGSGYPDNTGAEVVADPTAANNGIYRKSGSGWVKISDNTIASFVARLAGVETRTEVLGETADGRFIVVDEAGFGLGTIFPGGAEFGGLRIESRPDFDGFAVLDRHGFVLMRPGVSVDTTPDPETPEETYPSLVPHFSPTLAGFAGEEVSIFPRQMMSARRDRAQLSCTVASTVGLNPHSRRGTDHLTVDVARLGASAVLALRGSDIAARAERALAVYAAPVPASGASPVKVLGIGDSIYNREGSLHLKTFLEARGYQASFLGTMLASGLLGEGREGWRAADLTYYFTTRPPVAVGGEAAYLAGSPTAQNGANPFIRAATGSDNASVIRNGYVFDPAFYVSRFGLATPDVVVYGLGTNDVTRFDANEIYAATVDAETVIMTQIRAAWPSAHVVRFLPAPAWGASGRDRWDTRQIVLIQAMMDVIRTRADPRVYICPSWAMMDLQAGFSLSAGDVDPTTGATVSGIADEIHPVLSARAQLYYAVAGYVAAVAANSGYPLGETGPRWWTGASYLLDGVTPVVNADFSRGRYAVDGVAGVVEGIARRTGGSKWVVGANGNLTQVPANTLAFDYASGRRRLRLEGAATNLFVGSAAPAAQSITVTAQSYAISWWGSGNLERSGAAATVLASYTEPFGGRHVLVLSMAAGTLTLTPVGTVTRPQVEVGIYPTSYIETSSGTANRVTDICQLASGAAAAFGATAVGPTATVWRGRYRVPSSDGIHNLMSFSRGGVHKDFIRPSLSSDGTTLRLQVLTPARPDAGFDTITINVPADPSEVGVAVTWDGAGMMASANGQSPQTAARPGAEGISAVWFGTQTGFLAGDVAEVDELLVWPVKGSSAAIQSQARMWA